VNEAKAFNSLDGGFNAIKADMGIKVVRYIALNAETYGRLRRGRYEHGHRK
jgi:hypothetical protein